LVLKDFVWAGCALEKQTKTRKTDKNHSQSFQPQVFLSVFLVFLCFLNEEITLRNEATRTKSR